MQLKDNMLNLPWTVDFDDGVILDCTGTFIIDCCEESHHKGLELAKFIVDKVNA